MGWLWSSATSPTESVASPETSHVTTPIQLEQALPPPTHPESPPSPPKRQLTRDEIAEAELRSFLEELEADSRQPSSRKKYNRTAQPPPPSQSNNDNSNVSNSPSNLTLEEELFPTAMSCRQAFDAAFYCQSLGGQFNNLYRYGGIRSCSENWKDFWFCMRTKSYSLEQNENMIRDHYRRKSLKYKVGPSSEDIWESREKRLEWGEAFSEPVEVPAGSDEEWNRRERLRRESRVDGKI